MRDELEGLIGLARRRRAMRGSLEDETLLAW
jgi:hypothetical protein